MSTPVKPTRKAAIKTAIKSKTPKTVPAKFVAPPSQEEIASLAEKYWAERGHPHGSPEHDWIRAERELIGQAS